MQESDQIDELGNRHFLTVVRHRRYDELALRLFQHGNVFPRDYVVRIDYGSQQFPVVFNPVYLTSDFQNEGRFELTFRQIQFNSGIV